MSKYNNTVNMITDYETVIIVIVEDQAIEPE